ncbi:MAG: hypothetical protein ACKO24_10315 [Leptolyngbyaceae cyanobacterium]
MHFEILVEDISGKIALEILVPKIIDIDKHSFRIHDYKGAGRIPKDLQSKSDPKKRILLDRLPRLIQGYGKTFSANPNYSVIIVCDLDDRCLSAFRKELLVCADKCNPKPATYFCIAIEEGEAWYLGDLEAVKKAYPNAKSSIFNTYVNDSICGTWEKLADAIFPGGSTKLSRLSAQIGKEKSAWAQIICPHMNVDENSSPSFCYFRDKLRHLIEHLEMHA